MEQCVKARVLSLRPKAPAIECSRTVRKQGRSVGTNAPSVRDGHRGKSRRLPDVFPPSKRHDAGVPKRQKRADPGRPQHPRSSSRCGSKVERVAGRPCPRSRSYTSSRTQYKGMDPLTPGPKKLAPGVSQPLSSCKNPGSTGALTGVCSWFRHHR